ncbi:hypothetical protein BHE74_00038970 [Ensete ventricosum]|nr:hypothetical protein BHE74_00038970 [Ensete ventricosum]RZR98967.1 hypothetical protein BHM03_00028430 [Ensete ventricosum]
MRCEYKEVDATDARERGGEGSIKRWVTREASDELRLRGPPNRINRLPRLPKSLLLFFLGVRLSESERSYMLKRVTCDAKTLSVSRQ